MAYDLTDQVIIITGASSGIGAATVIECAKAGMDVVINARREDRLQQVAEEVRRLGRKAEVVVGDVTDAGISNRMLDAARDRFGRFDAVFANAGFGFDKPVHEVSDRELREIFDVNFFAGVELIQKATRRLIDAKRPGHLLMCSSCLAKFTIPLSAAYSATKAAQNHMCRAMRIELAPYGIQVASVHPIGTSTEFFEVSAQRSGRPKRPSNVSPGFLTQPPERVARAVVRCLRRPRPEVWTSLPVRLMAGFLTMSPRLADLLMRLMARRTLRQNTLH